MKWIRHFVPFITWVHRLLFPLTGGRLGTGLIGVKILLLEHVGRKTGLPRKTPLLYVEDGGRFIVAASNAGQDRHPAWWLNVEAKPEVFVSVVRKPRITARARRATGDEEARLWEILGSSYRWFEQYREGTDRDIPVVILEPTSSERSVQ